MFSQKEDAKTEKVIRGLLKLPANRRCINCNILGPQYVCTTFNTFVCINCSGIHREFTHRVKSVSMAKFSPEEVTALEAGGNERAKQIYFKEWDPVRHSYPDPSNMQRLRDFIKHAYVDRKFTGERGSVVLSRLRLNDREESYASKKISSIRLESRSPQYEDRFERHHSERFSPSLGSDDKSFRFYYDERRSPKYSQKHARPGSFGRSPIKFEVVDDRFRDDEVRNRRFTNLESKFRQLQPDSQEKNVDGSQPRLVREVSEENGPSPRVGEPSQAQNKEASNFAQNQVTHYSGDSSAEKKPGEKKVNNPPEKLRDSDAAAAPETQPISQPSENNWASFEAYTVDNAPKTSNSNTLTSSIKETTPKATYANSLDLLLSELSGPLTVTTASMSEVSSGDNDPTTATEENASACGDLKHSSLTSIRQTTASPNTSDALWGFEENASACGELKHSPPTSIGQTTASPNNTDALSVTSTTATEMKQPSIAASPHVDLYNREDSVEVSHEQTLSSIQIPPSASVSSSTTQPTSTPVRPEASNDPPPDVPNSCDSSSAFTELSSQITSKPAEDTKPDVGSQTSSVETKSSGRKELPADLFTMGYLSGPAPLLGWQNVQQHGMGCGLQYYRNAVPPSAFPIAAKSTNPFEETQRTLSHASSFPTMASLNGVLPAASPGTGLMHSSSFGSSGSMLPQPPSYVSQVPPQSTLASGFPTGVYFGQVNNNMQPPRPERVGSFNGDRDIFGPQGTIQPSGGEYMTPGTPNSFSKMGGNPFENV